MKRKILSFFLLSFIVIIPSYAQLTITSLPRQAEFVDVFFSGGSNFSAPSEGPSQVWDYGDVTKMGESAVLYTAALNHPSLPNALHSFSARGTFNAFIIPITSHMKLDEHGLFEMSRSIEPTSFSITTISGGQNDSLHFLGIHDVHDNCGRPWLKFPFTYLDQWDNTYIENVPFALSVAAFGLDRTPGLGRSTIIHSRKVVGYGDIVIPKTDGTPSVPIEALLVKINETRIDSYYLNNALAPDLLLGAFGLTQGLVTKVDTRYCWFNPNFETAILCMRPNEFFSYRPEIADAAVTTAIKETDVVASTYFPNPVAIGQTLTIATETQLTTGTIQLTDIRGRVVYHTPFNTPNHPEFQITIPATLNEGMYLYQIQDEQALPISIGKVFVNR